MIAGWLAKGAVGWSPDQITSAAELAVQ